MFYTMALQRYVSMVHCTYRGHQRPRYVVVAGMWRDSPLSVFSYIYGPLLTCEACTSGDGNGECFCQDKCEQRFDCGFSTSLTNLTFDMTSVPCGDDGERVCEGHGYNEIFCGRIGCCTWDSGMGECISSVAQNSCQPGMYI